MADALCLVDSNVLIRWVQPGNIDFPSVRAAIDILIGYGTELCYTSQNLGEFWNACTRPLERNGFGIWPEETDRRAKLFETRLRLLPDGILVHEEWRRLLVEHRISGVQVHDTRLVAVMNVYGVRQILTYNTKDFLRFGNIRAFQPTEVISTL
jgi:predicted nucleic acid-binding protein